MEMLECNGFLLLLLLFLMLQYCKHSLSQKNSKEVDCIWKFLNIFARKMMAHIFSNEFTCYWCFSLHTSMKKCAIFLKHSFYPNSQSPHTRYLLTRCLFFWLLIRQFTFAGVHACLVLFFLLISVFLNKRMDMGGHEGVKEGTVGASFILLSPPWE